MALGVIATKVGMTQLFTEEGGSIPVTVLEVRANRVTQVKDEERDGYRAIQVTTGSRAASRLPKSVAGHYAKASVEPGLGLWEFRLAPGEGKDLKPGAEIKADLFQVGQRIDVQGTTIGKGFAGVIKRHHFSGGRASHGASLSHRTPGSIGQRTTPGRVFPGKKMAGRLGGATRTQQNLEVIRVDIERNLLLVRGAVPGSKGGHVIVRPAAKAPPAVAKQQ